MMGLSSIFISFGDSSSEYFSRISFPIFSAMTACPRSDLLVGTRNDGGTIAIDTRRSLRLSNGLPRYRTDAWHKSAHHGKTRGLHA